VVTARVERRPLAGLAANVAGYRRPMGLNEEGALQLKPLRRNDLPFGYGGLVECVIRAPEPGRAPLPRFLPGNHARVCRLSRE